MKFGDNLKNLRKSKNLSQDDLAEKVGVSRQSVSKWECSAAYPEMNNILELCKIFNCKISDLINDNITDIDLLDDNTKKNLVKFQKNEQKKMKCISKIIKIISKICKIASMIALPVLILLVFASPWFLSNIDVNDNEIVWNGNEKISIKKEKDKLTLLYKDNIYLADVKEQVIDYYLDYYAENKTLVIVYVEVAFITLTVLLVLVIKIFSYLEKLFGNMYEGQTPFTLENVSLIRKIAYLMIASSILPSLIGSIFELVTRTDFGVEWELFDLVEILFLFSMVYIFKYGYELQLDSKATMYEDINE